ncbi:MAG: hypothetical protein MK207_12605 [Saprospiraceae bacterium]|nr:hypothetical protein [Saprospiraceae bacterium]
MFKFFNTTKFKPREFGYKPRFYDPEKEEFESRIKNRAKNNLKGEQTKSRIHREFNNLKSGNESKKGKGLTSSSLRLFFIIIILAIASYFVLDNLLPKLIQNWFPEQNEQYEFLEEYENS